MDLQERYLVYSRSVVPIVCSSTLWLSCGTVTSPFGGPGSILCSLYGPVLSHLMALLISLSVTSSAHTHTYYVASLARLKLLIVYYSNPAQSLLLDPTTSPALPRTRMPAYTYGLPHTHMHPLSHIHTHLYIDVYVMCVCACTSTHIFHVFLPFPHTQTHANKR